MTTRRFINQDSFHPDDPIAEVFPASDESVTKVMHAPVGDDGRSKFEWVRLQNGDLILGVWPTGEGYFNVELNVEADYSAAIAPEVALLITTPPVQDAQSSYVIVNTNDEKLFWNKSGKWVDLEGCQVFHMKDTPGHNLPINGEWMSLEVAEERQNEKNNGCCECGEIGHDCSQCPVFSK